MIASLRPARRPGPGPRLRRLFGVCAVVLAAMALQAALADDGGESASLGPVFLIFAAVAAAIALGEPLFVIIGVIAALCFLLWGDGYDEFDAYQIFVVKIANLTKKNVLLAIPFFMISGAIMTAGGIAGRLIAFAKALVGHLPGGLAIATVGGCIFFAAISGSSPATVIAIGTMMYPALAKSGYPERFSLGLVTSAGSLGILIPPSIPMLVFAIVAGTSRTVDVGELFLAGVVPGALIGGLMSLYSVYVGWNLPREAFSLRRVITRYREGFWALNLPVLILGGIYSGMFTATEAAAVSVIYALVVELFVHREITLGDIPGILLESGILMGSLLVIMAMSFGLNHFLADAQVPQRAVVWIREMELSPIMFLLALNLLLIAVGFVMDSISAILILSPLLVPIGVGLGLDPVHLGVVFIVNLEIGYLTPPIGLNLFVSQSVFGQPLGAVVRSVVPFIGLMLVGLVLVTYLPTVSLGPVNWLLRDQPIWTSLPEAAPEEVVEEPVEEPVAQPKKVLSLQEMMQQAKEQAAGEGEESEEDEAEAPEAPEEADSEAKPRVRSLQELMKMAREKTAEPKVTPPPEAEPTP
ncbi:MAG: TRAP transporter large permease [Deltaproteobacteria bacterium]|nr:TRAP transporter large permease [Deltaproteobacteria bacterium]